MSDEPEQGEVPEDFLVTVDATESHVSDMLTLEIVFLGFIFLVTVAALVQSLGYAIVSARTPLVIMVPLFVLIVVQGRRLWSLRDRADPSQRIRFALRGGHPTFSKVASFSAWMVALLLTILVLGHYAGIFLFCLALMRLVAKEPLKLSLIVSAAVTVVMYVIFELGFDVELYRGLVPRYLMGYRDF